jgi:hypothetical protein
MSFTSKFRFYMLVFFNLVVVQLHNLRPSGLEPRTIISI